MNKRIHTTLGDLIAAVTNEVEQATGHDDMSTDIVVSRILNRLFIDGTVRFTRCGTLSSA